MSTVRRSTGWTLVLLSLALHLVTLYAFVRQPDRLTAFTVLPIWIWGGFGIGLSALAFCVLKAPLSLMMTAVWSVTVLAGADESKVLSHLGNESPEPGPPLSHKGQPVLRVITMNCATFEFGSPSRELARWQPDIVLLQDAFPQQVREIADMLYGGRGDYRCHGTTNGIATRWRIEREIRNPTARNQQVTIRLSEKSSIEVVNLHLESAATDLRLWNRWTWTNHRINRAKRVDQAAIVRSILEETTAFPNTPVILGGDFNAPAGDIVHQRFSDVLEDSFAAAGTGWGNTFHRRFPILRIDMLFHSPHFTAVRAKAVETSHSDHRMVVVDYVRN